jgi:hypothetical protein
MGQTFVRSKRSRIDATSGAQLPHPTDDLATLTGNTVCFSGQKTLTGQSTPTPVQRRALSLLGVALDAA